MHTVKDWIEFLKVEPNTTFAVEDVHGVYARHYLSAEELFTLLADYPEWLEAVPTKVYVNNNRKGGTKFMIDVLGKG